MYVVGKVNNSLSPNAFLAFFLIRCEVFDISVGQCGYSSLATISPKQVVIALTFQMVMLIVENLVNLNLDCIDQVPKVVFLDLKPTLFSMFNLVFATSLTWTRHWIWHVWSAGCRVAWSLTLLRLDLR